MLEIKEYKPIYCEEMAELFYNTVHTINAKDYTIQQRKVWATGEVDLVAWNTSFLKNYTLIAVEGEKVVGFGDITATGYLDRLYVHKDYQRKKIATTLCDRLEKGVEVSRITTHASITARPFFEKRGYVVVKEQQVERKGILLTNYVMEKKPGRLVGENI